MSAGVEALQGLDVPRETAERLELFATLLRQESERQNLIARSTLEEMWTRHLLDSAQLIRFAPGENLRWVDVGSGAGLPGIVLAILSPAPIVLVEPRRLRADFLRRSVERLAISHVTVACTKVERLSGQFDVITARAVAAAGDLFTMTIHLSHPETRWILPKGRSGAKELADARRAWQGHFRTEPSITDAEAVILVAEGVRPRGGTSR